MSISTENAHVTIEFQYKCDETPDTTYFVKYHFVGNMPLISVSGDGKEWIDFPAGLFTEVVSFLSQQGIGKDIPAVPVASTLLRVPRPETALKNVVPAPGTRLPLPKIEKQAEAAQPAADIDPLQTFSGLEALAERVSVSSPTNETKEKAKAREEQELAEARQRLVIRGADEATAAAMRAPNAEKVIKSRHR